MVKGLHKTSPSARHKALTDFINSDEVRVSPKDSWRDMRSKDDCGHRKTRWTQGSNLCWELFSEMHFKGKPKDLIKLCFFVSFFFLKTGLCYVSQAALELLIFLPQPPEGLEFKPLPPHLAQKSSSVRFYEILKGFYLPWNLFSFYFGSNPEAKLLQDKESEITARRH